MTIAHSMNLDDPDSLTKEEAFYDACNRYDAETVYFNSTHNFYSGVLPSRELAEALVPYHRLLVTKHFPKHTIFRSQVVRNVPGKVVNPHIDPRLYHMLSHRVHAVLTTNSACGHVYFDEGTHEAKILKMPAGFLYDFDNITPHAAFNLGQTGRLHIISDVIDTKWVIKYNSTFKKNPNYIVPGTEEKYYRHLRAIEAKYGGPEGLRQHYQQALNTL
jgi:hypothetical protein